MDSHKIIVCAMFITILCLYYVAYAAPEIHKRKKRRWGVRPKAEKE